MYINNEDQRFCMQNKTGFDQHLAPNATLAMQFSHFSPKDGIEIESPVWHMHPQDRYKIFCFDSAKPKMWGFSC